MRGSPMTSGWVRIGEIVAESGQIGVLDPRLGSVDAFRDFDGELVDGYAGYRKFGVLGVATTRASCASRTFPIEGRLDAHGRLVCFRVLFVDAPSRYDDDWQTIGWVRSDSSFICICDPLAVRDTTEKKVARALARKPHAASDGRLAIKLPVPEARILVTVRVGVGDGQRGRIAKEVRGTISRPTPGADQSSASEGGAAAPKPVPPPRPSGPQPYSPSLQYEVGDVVVHPTFGKGRVVRACGNQIEVDFPKGVKKRLAQGRP